MSGTAFQTLDSSLGQTATAARTSANGYDRATGNALFQVQGALRDALERGNPDAAGAMAAARDAYSKMLRVQTAAARPGGEPGVFSPDQFQSAVRQLDPTRLKGAYARGNALLQDFADNASAALKPPQLAGGHAQDIGAGIIGSRIVEHLFEHPFNPMTYAGVAAYPFMRGLYSNAGRSVLNPMIAGASALGNGVGALTPIAAQIAARRMTGLPMPPQPPAASLGTPSYPGALAPGGYWSR
jgi:hypothetical protein